MTSDFFFRVSGIFVCLCLLSGLFILGGTDWPADPSPSVGPDAEELEEDFAEEIGEEIEEEGQVTDADEPVVEIVNEDASVRVELQGQEDRLANLEEDELVTFSGEITGEQEVEVHTNRVAVREPWEVQYMYGISLGGALLTALFGVNYWRFNVRKIQIEPRERPLIAILGRDNNG